MMQEILELKAAGLTVSEIEKYLRTKTGKSPSLPTIRKYFRMDKVPDDFGVKLKKDKVFDVEPFRGSIIEILEKNPRCHISSVFDVLEERYLESGRFDRLPGNAQTLRNFVGYLKESGVVELDVGKRRTYDPVPDTPPGEQALIDFGQERCEKGLTVHFLCILLRCSRLLGVYMQDHAFSAEEACRAIYRFFIRCSGRPEELVIDQDAVFITTETYGEVIETKTFGDFVSEQGLKLWVCNKADPESKGPIENSVGFVKKNFFSARTFTDIEEVLSSLSGWLERKNRRIHQATYLVPLRVFENIEREALRPLLPSVYEASPTNLIPVKVGSMPFIQYKSSKYSVPRGLCFNRIFYKVVAEKLYLYSTDRRHICTHHLNPNKGSYNTLPEHAKETSCEWMVIAERLRAQYNCFDFQHFINGFKKENPRHLYKQLKAVEDYLIAKNPSRGTVAEVMAICCRDWRYRFSQFKDVYEAVEGGYSRRESLSFTEVETKSLDSWQQAFEERCAV